MKYKDDAQGSDLSLDQTNSPAKAWVIKAISIALVILVPILVSWELSTMPVLFSEIVNFWDISATYYFLPILIFAIAIFPFFFKKKIGWYLLATYLTYNTIFSIGLFIQAINWQSSGISLIVNFFVQKFPPIIYIILIIFFCGTLWIVCKKNIRVIYKVDKSNMLWTLGVTGITAALLFIYYYKYIE